MSNTFAWLFFTLLLGTVHTFFSTGYMAVDPFPFINFGLDSNGNQVYISYQAYVDRICDYLIWIIWIGLLAYHVPKFLKFGVWAFFSFQVFDLVDYLLFYNSIWTNFVGVALSLNVVKSIVFGFVILRAWMRSIGG